MELNPNVDLEINVSNLESEFRKFPTFMYRYCLSKADAEREAGIAKAKLKEVRALTYKRVKSDPTVKHTEKSLEAEIDSDSLVLQAQLDLITAEHNAATIGGAVEGMRSKKDMLIQLGSDRRKEL